MNENHQDNFFKGTQFDSLKNNSEFLDTLESHIPKCVPLLQTTVSFRVGGGAGQGGGMACPVQHLCAPHTGLGGLGCKGQWRQRFPFWLARTFMDNVSPVAVYGTLVPEDIPQNKPSGFAKYFIQHLHLGLSPYTLAF